MLFFYNAIIYNEKQLIKEINYKKMNNYNHETFDKTKFQLNNDKNNSKTNNNSIMVEYESSLPNYATKTMVIKNFNEVSSKLVKPQNKININNFKSYNNQTFFEKIEDKYMKKLNQETFHLINKNDKFPSVRIVLKKLNQNNLINSQNNSDFLHKNNSNDMAKKKSIKDNFLRKRMLRNAEFYSPNDDYHNYKFKIINSIYLNNIPEKKNINNIQYQRIKLPKTSRNDFSSSINNIPNNDEFIVTNNCSPKKNININLQIQNSILKNKKLLQEFKRSIALAAENLKNSNIKNSITNYNSPDIKKYRTNKNLNIPELLIINKKYMSTNKNLNSSSSNKNIKINNDINNNINSNIDLSENNENNNQENLEINKNSLRKSIAEVYKFKYHFYLILPGNASYLIKNCMCHRRKWKSLHSKASTLFNFKWKQISNGIDYNSLGKYGAMKQIVNHFENHFDLTNKANMFINLLEYCENHRISVFKYVPFTIVFDLKNTEKNTEEEKNTEFQKKIDILQKFIKISKDFVTNYKNIGSFYELEEYLNDQKNRKLFNMKQKNNNEKNENNKYIGEFVAYSDYFKGVKTISYVNDIIKDNAEFIEKEKLKEKNKQKIIGEKTVIEIPKTHYNGKNMWVIKAINLNRGKCIQIVNNFKQMETVINKFKNGVDYNFTKEIIDENQTIDFKNIKSNNNNNDNSNNDNINNSNINNTNNNNLKEEKERLYNCNKIIIQKYIENPLLYYGRKCDMRIWVLITHQMKVYIFKEGHLKTCSIVYDINSNNAFTHITNYSFQKYNSNFQKFEKGNEVPFYEFQKFIDENYPEKNYKIKNNLMKQIKEIVNLTARSVADKINKNKRNFQFEIFGYDFMLDSDFNLFLIEINTNPGLEESSPWIKIIVPRMLDDALRLTIDKIFDPGYDFNFNYVKNNNKENLLNNSQKNINLNPDDKININAISNNNNENKINTSADNIIIQNSEDKNDKKSQTYQKQCLTETEKEGNSYSNNKKYISPFPVPNYNLSENLWEFVCDLNSADPLDKKIKNEEEENNKNIAFTGIRHLLEKKKKKKKKSKGRKKEKRDGNKNEISEDEEE